MHVDEQDGGLEEPSSLAGNGHCGAPTQGEGIGLSIVKRLCDLLDATIQVNSSGAGTCFRILLPVRYAHEKSTPTSKAPDQGTSALRG